MARLSRAGGEREGLDLPRCPFDRRVWRVSGAQIRGLCSGAYLRIVGVGVRALKGESLRPSVSCATSSLFCRMGEEALLAPMDADALAGATPTGGVV